MRFKIYTKERDSGGDYNYIKVDECPFEGAVSMSHSFSESYVLKTYTHKEPYADIDEKGKPVLKYRDVVKISDPYFNEKAWKKRGTDYYYDSSTLTWWRQVEEKEWFFEAETLEDYQRIIRAVAFGDISDIDQEDTLKDGTKTYSFTIII